MACQSIVMKYLSIKRGASLLCGLLLIANLAASPPAISGDALYEPPPELDDGFQIATPEDIGLDRKPLEKMTGLLRADAYPNVHAVLIQKGGYLVYEAYFEGTDRRWVEAGEREEVEFMFDRDTLHDTRSVGKSITSALVGIAIASGLIKSVDVPVFQYFPEHADLATADKREITIENLLTMRAGLEWNEQDVPYTEAENDEIRMDSNKDPAGYVLAKKMANPPGSTFYYNSGLPTLSGIIVSRAVGKPFGDFARESLFEPLHIQGVEWGGCCDKWAGVSELQWESDQHWAQFANPAGSIWIRPRDLLKFGSLYLNEGRWNGVQILPDDWVTRSLEPLTEPRHFELELEHGPRVTVQIAYGYFWWHAQWGLPEGELVVHQANGNGGQRIWIVPNLDLVAVHLTGNYNTAGASQHAARLLLEQILPWASHVDAEQETRP